MDFVKKLSIFVLLLCVLIALWNQNQNLKHETDSPSLLEVEEPTPLPLGMLAGDDSQSGAGENERLTYGFYRESCPSAEDTIRSALRELYAVNATLAPQLLRLAFHDCFVSGCDASILLDSDANIISEKTAPPNLSLKGFEQIDDIKSRLEVECSGVVSCADILALAAREAVLVAGGNFYPVLTGRMDSIMAFPENATIELPSPKLDAAGAIDNFAAKGFSAKEMIALLGGGHSTGKIHCSFMRDRLFNFSGTNKPDPSIDTDFLEVLKAVCSQPKSSPSPSPSPSTSAEKSSPTSEDGAMKMDYEGIGKGFGEVYYRSLLRGRGLLFVDQQMTASEDTKAWVENYASDISLFRKDFADAMLKLTHLPGSHKGGGHSTGKIHCSFMRDRLFNFSGTNKPDPSIDTDFLEVLKAVCSQPKSSPSPSPSPSTSAEKRSASSEDGAMKMDYEGIGKGFGEVYYRSLLRGRGLLFVDQQMTASEDTKAWVENYASDISLFRKDFADAMLKLTHLPGSHKGEVRLNCRKVNNVL